MNILLVEDDVSLSNAVKRILEQQSYRVDAVYDGLSAVDYAKGAEAQYAVVLTNVEHIKSYLARRHAGQLHRHAGRSKTSGTLRLTPSLQETLCFRLGLFFCDAACSCTESKQQHGY